MVLNHDISISSYVVFYGKINEWLGGKAVKGGNAQSAKPVPWEGGGYNWTTLFLGDINMWTWPSRLDEFQIEALKYGPAELGPENYCAGKTQQ
jgi:hypothetical protein